MMKELRHTPTDIYTRKLLITVDSYMNGYMKQAHLPLHYRPHHLLPYLMLLYIRRQTASEDLVH